MKKFFVIGSILVLAMFTAVAFADNRTGMMGQGYGMMGAGGHNDNPNSQGNDPNGRGYGHYGPGYGYGMMGPGYGYGMMGPGYGYGMMGPGYGYGMMGPGYGYGMMGPGYGYGMMGPGCGYGMMGPGYGYGMMGPWYGHGMMGPGDGYGMMGPGYGYGYPGNVNREDLKKIYKAREDFFKDTQALREKIYKKRFALHTELAQKEPNADKASKLQKELSSLESEFAQKNIAFQLKMRKLLPKWEGRGGNGLGGNGAK
jgi:hypothetical protein